MLPVFFVLTSALGVAIIALALRVGFDGRARPVALGVLALWLALTAGAAAAGLLAPSPHRPPPNMVLALTGTIALCTLALTAPGRRMARNIPGHWVVGMQAFRIPVEVFLWAGSAAGLVPVLMSWHGRNFDVISGVLGLALGLVMAARPVPRPVLVAYHLLGLALVFNVVGHAVAATPGPLQQLQGPANEPAFVTTFPYVWLPAVLVPLAIAGHVLGLRQLALRPRETKGPDSAVGPAR